ncbi:MAG TPA: peptidylprolyl isomerase [Nitrospira sp.]|nr:peptidylprolyl isomerase [Nitrospira sp.]
MMVRRYSRMALCVVALAGLSLAGAPVQAETHKGASTQVVSKAKQVSLEYTLKLDDKNVLETNVGREPMTYTHGAQEIVPGLEKALEGLAVGDKKHVTVKPADGYGEVDPKAFQEVKKSQVPEKAWKVGAELEAKGPDGQSMLLRVTEVKADSVVLDFNHPLAGKTLYFDVKVLEIRAAAPPSK